MGNSSASSPCGQSQQQVLLNNFNKFNIPSDFLTSNRSVQTNGNVLKVDGKQNIQGNLFATKNYFNIIDSKSQIKSYYERFQGKDSQQFPIVKIHGVKQMEQNNICSSWKWYYVISEHIITFDQLSTSLSFEQCVYILFQALMGFFYLYAKHSSFSITQKMIGVSSQGKIKVWLNQNHGQNHPQNQTIQLYLTKNIKPQSQEIERQSKYILERQMIKDILSIINKKYKTNQNTFEMKLRKRIRQFIQDFSIKSCGFKDFLLALSILQQKSGDKLYIPNRIKLQKEFVSKLPERESFSQKLERAIAKYNAQIIEMRREEQKHKTFPTGKSGISMMKEYKQEKPLVIQQPQVTFEFQNNWKLTDFSHKYNFNQHPRSQLVRYAQSQMIDMGGTPYSERLQEFNFRPIQDRARINTYIPGDYENEIEMLSKDMRDTYFQSIGDSRSYLMKSRSITQDEKLSRSNSESQYYTMSSYYAPVTFTSPYLNGSDEKNLNKNPSSKMSYNLMQINEQHQAKQESIRPSLMSINVEGKSSLDYTRSKDRPIKNTNSKLSDSLQPIEQQSINPYEQEKSNQKKYEEKRFFVNGMFVQNITDRLKSQPSSL